MATATMGLRRRVNVNNSPSPTSQQTSASTSSNVTTSNVTNKRTRTENNNSLSHGNLNSLNNVTNQQNNHHRDEPPVKKSRGSGGGNSTRSRANSPAVTDVIAERHHHGNSGKGRNGGGKLSSRTKSPSIQSITTTVAATSTVTTASSASSVTSASSITVPSCHSGQQHPQSDITSGFGVLGSAAWPTSTVMPDPGTYTSITGLNMTGTVQAGLCTSSGLALPTSIPYMAPTLATFVGNATNLGKNSSVSYLDISNMTGGSMNPSTNANTGNAYACKTNGSRVNSGLETKGTNVPLPFSGVVPSNGNPGNVTYGTNVVTSQPNNVENCPLAIKTFQNDAMFSAYQPWVIKTYGDLAKTKTITIKKYARILRTLKGEEVNSAENSKFRFWVKSKGFHIGQPTGYNAKPADRIVGRHAVTSPGLDPPLYVPTQAPHNKVLNGAEGTVPPGRVYKKVAIVENFFDIIHAVHVDLEGRPGKHAGQKRTYRTITETYAFLPREAVTRFLLGCTECQRRPRTPSPSNLSNQSQVAGSTSAATTSTTSTITGTVTTSTTTRTMTPIPAIPTGTSIATTPLSPTPAATALSATGPRQTSPKPREASHPPESSKSLFSYRHPKHQLRKSGVNPILDKPDKDRDSDSAEKQDEDRDNSTAEKEKERDVGKYNPLSITNLLKKEPVRPFGIGDSVVESRRTPESDRASSRSSASSKRRRMLPEGRTPSPPPTLPLPTPWSPGIDPKNTPIDYSLPITTVYLKHQQRILAEKNKVEANVDWSSFDEEREREARENSSPINATHETDCGIEIDRFSPAAGLIDTNLNLLATIQHLHCQVMLALTERLRPSVLPESLVLPAETGGLTNILTGAEFGIGKFLTQRHS